MAGDTVLIKGRRMYIRIYIPKYIRIYGRRYCAHQGQAYIYTYIYT